MKTPSGKLGGCVQCRDFTGGPHSLGLQIGQTVCLGRNISTSPSIQRHFSELSRNDERTFNRLYREVDKMKIRIIGMPQATFPFSMNGYWNEAIGQLANDHHDAKVGSILRLDLKTYWAAGSIKPILSNISYAVDELDEAGMLRSEHLVSGAEPIWPQYGLPENTWLPIVCRRGSVNQSATGIRMYIKANRNWS